MTNPVVYGIYGPDNTLHYGRALGDPTISEDARFAHGYFIVHEGQDCKRRQVIVRRDNGTYEGIAACAYLPVYDSQDRDRRQRMFKLIAKQLERC